MCSGPLTYVEPLIFFHGTLKYRILDEKSLGNLEIQTFSLCVSYYFTLQPACLSLGDKTEFHKMMFVCVYW
jgi:hypothetical protein